MPNLVKSFIRSLFVVLIALMISCSYNDFAVSIAGKWKIVGSQVTGCINSAYNYETNCYSHCETVSFTGNAYTENNFYGGVITTGTYSITGNKITLTDSNGSETDAFVIAGSTLTLIASTDSYSGCTYSLTLIKQ